MTGATALATPGTTAPLATTGSPSPPAAQSVSHVFGEVGVLDGQAVRQSGWPCWSTHGSWPSAGGIERVKFWLRHLITRSLDGRHRSARPGRRQA